MRDRITPNDVVLHKPTGETIGIHIPAMDWDKDFREKMHDAYFGRKNER